jgi:hypothetical protein
MCVHKGVHSQSNSCNSANFVLNTTKFPVPTTNQARPYSNHYTELTRDFYTVCLSKYFTKDQWMKINKNDNGTHQKSHLHATVFSYNLEDTA